MSKETTKESYMQTIFQPYHKRYFNVDDTCLHIIREYLGNGTS